MLYPKLSLVQLTSNVNQVYVNVVAIFLVLQGETVREKGRPDQKRRRNEASIIAIQSLVSD